MAMSSPPKTSFLARIRDVMPRLHRSEVKLAETIHRFPGHLASYTATELAQLAGVSNATITRFVRKLGYSSFEEARQAVRSEQESGTALFRVDREGTAQDGQVRRYLDVSHENLERSLVHLDTDDLNALVSAMSEAERLWMIGFRAGQYFARYLAWQVTQVRANTFTLPRDEETLSESVASIANSISASCPVPVIDGTQAAITRLRSLCAM